jgi:hypothetical protein
MMRFKQLENEAGDSVSQPTVKQILREIMNTSPEAQKDEIAYKLANSGCETLREYYAQIERIIQITASLQRNSNASAKTTSAGSTWCRVCRRDNHNTRDCRRKTEDRRSRSRTRDHSRDSNHSRNTRGRSDSRTMHPRKNARYNSRGSSRSDGRGSSRHSSRGRSSDSRGSTGSGRKPPIKCYDCGKTDHDSRDCKSKKSSTAADRKDRPRRSSSERYDSSKNTKNSTLKCAFCKITGHTEDRCWKKNGKGSSASRSPRDRPRKK